MYKFLKIYIWGNHTICTALGKTVHFGTNTIVNDIKREGQCTKDVQLFSLVVQLFNGCTAFQKYIYEDHRICTALEKTVHFGTNTIVKEIKSQGQCTKDIQRFSLVVQLFNCCTAFWNIYMRITEFAQPWKKLYILVQTPLWIKLRAKDSVPKMYSFFLWLYSFLMVVQLFENIYIRTTEFVQLWKKLYILVETPLWMKLRAKDSVPKIYSFFLWMYSFLIVLQVFRNIHMRTTEFVQLWRKLYILVQTPLGMKLRAKDSVPKMYSVFLWLYSFSVVAQLFKNIYMRTTEFAQLCKKLYILVQTPLWMKLRAKDSVPKMYSFYLWLHIFLMVVHLFENIYI